MGFNSGFIGGVTITLGLTYLALHQHQRNREYQSLILKAQNATLKSSLVPVAPEPVPSRQEIEATARANVIDVSKDRWNREITNAVRTVQNTDWDDVREKLEIGAGRLWEKLTKA